MKYIFYLLYLANLVSIGIMYFLLPPVVFYQERGVEKHVEKPGVVLLVFCFVTFELILFVWGFYDEKMPNSSILNGLGEKGKRYWIQPENKEYMQKLSMVLYGTWANGFMFFPILLTLLIYLTGGHGKSIAGYENVVNFIWMLIFLTFLTLACTLIAVLEIVNRRPKK